MKPCLDLLGKLRKLLPFHLPSYPLHLPQERLGSLFHSGFQSAWASSSERQHGAVVAADVLFFSASQLGGKPDNQKLLIALCTSLLQDIPSLGRKQELPVYGKSGNNQTIKSLYVSDLAHLPLGVLRPGNKSKFKTKLTDRWENNHPWCHQGQVG